MKNVISLFLFVFGLHGATAQMYQFLDVQLRDQYFYERMDSLEQINYEIEFEEFQLALTYFEKGDYESTIYWAKECNYVRYEWGCTVYPLITVSYAHLGEKRQTKRWFKRLERFCGEPVLLRQVQADLDAIGAKY
jgi:hypothetical protein